MKAVVDEIAQKLRNALKETLEGFEGLYVFGSQVRGDAHEDSDIDIVVLTDKPLSYDTDKSIWRIVGKLEYDYDTFLDVHPKTREQLELNYFFHEEVVNNGVFYAAAA
ncbi:MAG: nucleotidyltransferase domain-containing protein [Heliobacteriaceae bacterium]|jgi:predicted nucleotidyltransferase|nr:nucleotidyltransferase domain-containing protein [Heliobacteriaceae bacterium]